MILAMPSSSLRIVRAFSTPAERDEFSLVKRWTADVDLKPNVQDGEKKMTVITDADKQIIDYKDVTLSGYLSTFENVTPKDRQGDYVIKGAFSETITAFMKNPVMLRDHRNSVDNLVGKFTAIREDDKGLYVEGALSNSPDVRNTRFKVAEGTLKTMSMGGFFFYKEDGKGIYRVSLFEGSLIPIPANPDARFNVRSLNADEKLFYKSADQWPSFYDFLEHVNSLRTPRGITSAA